MIDTPEWLEGFPGFKSRLPLADFELWTSPISTEVHQEQMAFARSHLTEESFKRRQQTSAENWAANPAKRAEQSARGKDRIAAMDPEERARWNANKTAHSKTTWACPERRAKLSAIKKAWWAARKAGTVSIAK